IGTEPFDTTADGIAVTEHPDPGEVVWCDDAGVTCRRWNWRQARRTQLRDTTTTALFILDGLDPVTDQALHAAADDLTARLTRLGPGVRAGRRLIAAGATPDEEACRCCGRRQVQLRQPQTGSAARQESRIHSVVFGYLLRFGHLSPLGGVDG